MLSPYAKNEWLTIIAVGACVGLSLVLLGYWPGAVGIGVATLAVLTFFRDPDRRIPSPRNIVVAPADGKISSIHEVEHFPPFDGPAVCVRVFMSVFDVHVNRCVCHGKVASITHQPGNHGNTLNPESIEDNESMTTLFVHPVKGHPVAAVRQVAGLLARTIHNGLRDEQVVQRGQRMGIIKLGSTSELYLPANLKPDVLVKQGQKVLAGMTVLANVTPLDPAEGLPPQITLFASPTEDDGGDGEPSVFAEKDPASSPR
ncbi:MAG: phosphatidylserine decarboxylase [Planctomycetota bacterium]